MRLQSNSGKVTQKSMSTVINILQIGLSPGNTDKIFSEMNEEATMSQNAAPFVGGSLLSYRCGTEGGRQNLGDSQPTSPTPFPYRPIPCFRCQIDREASPVSRRQDDFPGSPSAQIRPLRHNRRYGMRLSQIEIQAIPDGLRKVWESHPVGAPPASIIPELVQTLGLSRHRRRYGSASWLMDVRTRQDGTGR